jgi:hypothetical protein
VKIRIEGHTCRFSSQQEYKDFPIGGFAPPDVVHVQIDRVIGSLAARISGRDKGQELNQRAGSFRHSRTIRQNARRD